MDRQMLKQTYGDKLVFHGAMDNQYTLPFGTVAEVEQEVLDNIRILALVVDISWLHAITSNRSPG